MHHISMMADCNLPDVTSLQEMIDSRQTLEGDKLIYAFDVNCKDPTRK